MRLSDIKGRKALDIMADAMELVDLVSEDERFAEFREALKDARGDRDKVFRAFMRKLPPIIRDERYQPKVIAILAAASDVPYEEYEREGDVLKDILELFLSDSETLGFLSAMPADPE